MTRRRLTPSGAAASPPAVTPHPPCDECLDGGTDTAAVYRITSGADAGRHVCMACAQKPRYAARGKVLVRMPAPSPTRNQRVQKLLDRLEQRKQEVAHGRADLPDVSRTPRAGEAEGPGAVHVPELSRGAVEPQRERPAVPPQHPDRR